MSRSNGTAAEACAPIAAAMLEELADDADQIALWARLIAARRHGLAERLEVIPAGVLDDAKELLQTSFESLDDANLRAFAEDAADTSAALRRAA